MTGFTYWKDAAQITTDFEVEVSVSGDMITFMVPFANLPYYTEGQLTAWDINKVEIPASSLVTPLELFQIIPDDEVLAIVTASTSDMVVKLIYDRWLASTQIDLYSVQTTADFTVMVNKSLMEWSTMEALIGPHSPVGGDGSATLATITQANAHGTVV